MKNEIIYSGARIVIETVLSSVQNTDADIVLLEAGETNRKSRIIVNINGAKLEILFIWSRFGFSDDVGICIHFQENSNLLFLGGGSLSAVINLKTKEILHYNFPMLFWNWEILGDHILELGEIECRLYNSVGALVGEAPVDPPYEYKVTNGVIEFSSIVHGKTCIKFRE